jgi:hypothetical protein
MEEQRQAAHGDGSPQPYDASSLPAIWQELTKQTDRGCAVVAGAFLEGRIRSAIMRAFVCWDLPKPIGKPDAMGARIIGTDKSPGELGFLDQCRLAYCLGLIGPGAFRDLERIGKVRNLFAHHVTVRSFEDNPDIVKYCRAIEAPGPYGELLIKAGATPNNKFELGGSPRNIFLFAVMALWMAIDQLSIGEGFNSREEADVAARDPNAKKFKVDSW